MAFGVSKALKRNAALVLSGGLLVGWLCGCTEEPTPVAGDNAGSEVLEIVAINSPLADFARHLGGDAVRVTLPVPAGEDPALWIPDVEDILTMQSADLVLLNGAGYEPWLGQVSLPVGTVVDTSRNLADSLIYTDSVTHQHGPDGDHSHGASAFTIWLDPLLALEQAKAIRDALQSRRADLSSAIDGRFSDLEVELLALHHAWQNVADKLGDAPVIFSHPVYQYLQQRYQFNGRSLHWEPDEDPGEVEWQALKKLLTTHPAALMIWEAEPVSETLERLATSGIRVAVVDPGANSKGADRFLGVQHLGVLAVSPR